MAKQFSLFADGGARGNPGPAGAGFVIYDDSGNVVVCSGSFLGRKTNNQAEYTALVLGCKKARELGVSDLKIFLDSKLVVEQISRNWKIKDDELRKLAELAWKELDHILKWVITHIPRAKNHQADLLVNRAIDSGSDVCGL